MNQHEDANSVSGLWSGGFWYRGAPGPTPFSAWLRETDGDVVGTMLEPNMTGDPLACELSATVTGSRGDLSLRFTKLYDPAPGVHSLPIYHRAEVDREFTVIEGEWDFGELAKGVGRFVLVRVSGRPSRGSSSRADVGAS